MNKSICIKISYFNNIRNFRQNTIPISTAIYDPKWYHNEKQNSYIFVDKHGIVNGIRMPSLHADITHTECINCNKENAEQHNCSFLTAYYDKLKSYKFDDVINALKEIAEVAVHTLQYAKDYDNIDIVLLVHEKPNALCSERDVLKQWFKDNGYDLQEYV